MFLCRKIANAIHKSHQNPAQRKKLGCRIILTMIVLLSYVFQFVVN